MNRPLEVALKDVPQVLLLLQLVILEDHLVLAAIQHSLDLVGAQVHHAVVQVAEPVDLAVGKRGEDIRKVCLKS